MNKHAEIPAAVLATLRAICLPLPEAYEEPAWVGTRWRIRRRTFAHVLTVESGWPPAYARALGTSGPVTVVMLRSTGSELDALRHAAPPFFTPPWRADKIGIVVDTDIDWGELAELLIDSYCVLAPKKVVE